MHVMKTDGINSHFWSNSLYHNAGTEANIQLPILSKQQKICNRVDQKNKKASILKPLSYHDVVKVINGAFLGYYAIVTEVGDLSQLDDDDEIEINYLKKSYGKWVINKNDLDSRMLSDLAFTNSTVDGRSRYTIIE